MFTIEEDMILWQQFLSIGEFNHPFNMLECGCKGELLNIAQVNLIGWMGMGLWNFISLDFRYFSIFFILL